MSDDIQRDQSHPLYEFTQVITHDELHGLHEEMYRVYQDVSWWNWIDKLKLAGAYSAITVLLVWLHGGKDYGVPFMQNYSGTGGNHEAIDN